MNAGAIAVVPAVVFVVGAVLVVGYRTRRIAATFTLGGTATWALLFAWRAGSARVIGANLFIIPLVILVIPTAGLLPLLVRAAVHRRRP